MVSAADMQDSEFRPRKPQQQRARQRVERVLQEAECLLGDTGLGGFSIPTLADRLGYPHATVYKFFPSPYTVLNELAQRHLNALQAQLVATARALPPDRDHRAATRAMVQSAADYYRQNRVACMLLLGGPFTDASYRAMEYAIRRLGRLCRRMLARAGMALPEGELDAAGLAVELGTASFRYAYFVEGTINDAYVEAASEVMITFLEGRVASIPASGPTALASEGLPPSG